MKSQKLIALASTACLLFGVSGAAMAVDCASGAIEGTIVNEIIIDGKSCLVDYVLVLGDVKVLNSEDFTMVNSTVNGNVRVIGGRYATLFGNLTTSDFVVSNNERASILFNGVAGSMRVNNNNKADVKRNGVALNLLCIGNTRLDSFQNEVGGGEDCRRSGIIQ